MTTDTRLTTLDAVSDHKVSLNLGLGDSWDGGDVWGSAMIEAFTLCDWLMFKLGAPDVIPDAIGFDPSCFGADDSSYEWENLEEMWPDAGLTPEDVGEYLILLNALFDECETLGLDY